MRNRSTKLTGPILVLLVGVLYALGAQWLARPLASEGMYFQSWSSEDMMQTVALKHLRDEPLLTLLYTHIQPPGFDALRAFLVSPLKGLSDEAAVRTVDQLLYILGALLVGVLVAVTYAWLSHYGAGLALFGALFLLLHPSVIFFATFLDSTLLTSVLILCLYYALWRVNSSTSVPVALFSVLVLLLFLTRSAFQLPAILVVAVSLYFLGMGTRRTLVFMVATGLLAGAFITKQMILFGIPSTSSFTGISLANSIGRGLGTDRYETFLSNWSPSKQPDPSLPAVLMEPTKPNGRPNFNHIGYLELNRQLLADYGAAIGQMNIYGLARNYLENAFIYFMPTSSYDGSHAIADRLPWRSAYSAVFSAPVLPLLLLLALAYWLSGGIHRGAIGRSVGLLLPGLFVFAVSIMADKGENMRFKFWLEPTMLIVLVTQFHGMARRMRRSWRPYPAQSARQETSDGA